jgi:hypothetical protein
MYPEGYAAYVTVDGELTNKLCGPRRPGHFRGWLRCSPSCSTFPGPRMPSLARRMPSRWW